jgi:hypothetical protein
LIDHWSDRTDRVRGLAQSLCQFICSLETKHKAAIILPVLHVLVYDTPRGSVDGPVDDLWLRAFKWCLTAFTPPSVQPSLLSDYRCNALAALTLFEMACEALELTALDTPSEASMLAILGDGLERAANRQPPTTQARAIDAVVLLLYDGAVQARVAALIRECLSRLREAASPEDLFRVFVLLHCDHRSARAVASRTRQYSLATCICFSSRAPSQARK